MKVLWFLAVIAMLICSVAAVAAPKVAVVYSSWGGGSFQREFDEAVNDLNWNIEKFENVKVSDLVQKINDFNIVIAASTGNYENTQDMGLYKDQWLDYLNKGGILFVVDANYDSVLGSWINRLGPDFVLTTSGCAPYTKSNGGSADVKFDPNSPILYVPNDVTSSFVQESGIWAHIDSWPAGWTSLITCADKKSLFLYKRVGKGMVAVTSYASLQGVTGKELSEKLLNNMLLFTQSANTGIEIVSSKFPEAAPGKHGGQVVIRNSSDAVKNISLKIHSEPANAVLVSESKSVRIDPGKNATIPFEMTIAERGKIVVSVDVTADNGGAITLVRKYTIPEKITFTAENRHQYNAKSVSFKNTLAPDADIALKNCTLDIIVDGNKVKSVKSPKSAAVYEIKTAGLQYGTHTAEASLLYNGSSIASQSSEFVLNPQPRIYSRKDGTLMINGKPEFPFGWYHVSWGKTVQDRVDFIKSIGEAGFNVAHMSCDKAEDWKTILDESAKVGVRVITEYGGDYPALIQKYKDHPAVMAWNPGDEPDGQGISPEEMLRRANKFRDIDPNHPAYMVLCVPSTYSRYAGSADIIAPDIYPIPNGKVADVYKFLLSARTEASRNNRPIWSVVQCFGYETKDSWRVPTVDECRNMTYQSLLAGAKGIIYYTYYDSGFYVQKFPTLWQGMKNLVPEINAMKPYLVSGMPVSIKTGSDDILAGVWKYKGRHMLVVLNTNEKNSAAVKLALPNGADKTFKSLLSSNSGDLSVSTGKLSGKLKPLAVEVFVY